ncbi:MAG: FecR domain-containing protein [Spirochaetes bacterium]|nr:FecR domain-containing protein [Spirochaetota bacterium]
MKSRIPAFLFTTVILGIAALAAQSLGTITSLKGRVSIQSGSDAAKPAAVKQEVKEGDYLTTQADGEAVITLTTGTVMKVGPETRMKINKSKVTSGDGNQFSVGLTKGSISAKVSKLKTASDSFNVYTPTSVAGVRGTDFSVAAGVDGSTRVQVAEGEVQAGRGENKTSLKEKQGTEVGLTDKPVEAKSGSEDLAAWVAKNDKKAKENPEKTLADMQAYIDKSSQSAASTAAKTESIASSQTSITNKEQLKSQISSAQSANAELNFNQTVAEGILVNAKAVAGSAPEGKAKELLSGVERIAKAFDDANSRIEAALARLDARLAAARKRIDDSWKGADSRINKSMQDDRFKKFDEQYEKSKKK